MVESAKPQRFLPVSSIRHLRRVKGSLRRAMPALDTTPMPQTPRLDLDRFCKNAADRRINAFSDRRSHLVAVESSSSANWARKLIAMGLNARIIAEHRVSRYRLQGKRGKNDANDAVVGRVRTGVCAKACGAAPGTA